MEVKQVKFMLLMFKENSLHWDWLYLKHLKLCQPKDLLSHWILEGILQTPLFQTIMQVSIASTIRAMVILLISALVSVMTLKTSFNLARSLSHPSISQTSRLILSPTTMVCLLILGVDWLRSLVFVIAFHKSLSFQCMFQFSVSLLFQLSISLLFQFSESFTSCTLLIHQ